MNAFKKISSKVVLGLGALGMAGALTAVTFPSVAGATSLDVPPTFECYQGLSVALVGGNLVVDKISVNDDSGTTGWFPAIYRWSGTAWHLYKIGFTQHFSDSGFGSLEEQPEKFQIPVHGYYAVKIYVGTTGDRTVQYDWARAMTGGDPIGSTTCYL